ncbi:MAG: hypothetical protein JSW54_08545 [Fidelibacterota bacterium]|nr:MAG: hypothetical protein JSW54_08545 [Candidatus Neomarinimicrobiota bacterium]
MIKSIRISAGLVVVLLAYATPGHIVAQLRFSDDFENGLERWELVGDQAINVHESGDPEHGKVLVLKPDGQVYALVRDSDQWSAIRVEGDILFPRNEHNYFGLIYHYNQTRFRTDFSSIYIKGNGSYIRANPHRDGNVSRLMYEEYRTRLTSDQAIQINQWHAFKAEIMGPVCHLYVGDMSIPKLTFSLYEHSSGLVGFKPRVAGGDVWLDNVRITSIEELSYTGPDIPAIDYETDSLITDWEVLGPLTRPVPEIEHAVKPFASLRVGRTKYTWEPFEVDIRGAVITGKVTEYLGERSVAYFRTVVHANTNKAAILHVTTLDELALWINDRFYGYIYRDGYVSGDNDWNAWYDFWKNPAHAGRRIPIELKPGANQILVRTRNGQYASGGFFARLESP